jgi:hypothetical protein
MRPAIALTLALVASLPCLPAVAQRAGCGFGAGLEGMRAAARALAEPPRPSLVAGRDLAGATATRLREAAAVLDGCGCRQAAAGVGEAAALSEEAQAQSSLDGLRRLLDRAGFSLRLARERLDRQGCS